MKHLSCPIARLLARIAEREAAALGIPMVIAMTDAGGELLHFVKMDGALPASSGIAVSKAYTAASLRMATEEVGRLAQPGQELYGIQHTLEGRVVLFGGGIPLKLEGRVVGAVGISGGTVSQDIQVAQPVVDAFNDMTCWAEQLCPLAERIPINSDPIAVDRLLALMTGILTELSYGNAFDAAHILTGALLLCTDTG